MVSRAGRRPRLILWAGWMAGGVACALVVTAVEILAGTLHQGEHDYWRLSGPPCPTYPGRLTSKRPPGQVFAFEGLTIARAAGAASCSGLFEGGSWSQTEAVVCQFTHPVTLRVGVGGQTRWFFPDVARPATLTLRKGALNCVLASNFRD